jgi:hypothetical protein
VQPEGHEDIMGSIGRAPRFWPRRQAEGERTASCLGRFIPEETATGTNPHSRYGRYGEEKNRFPLPGIEPR